MRLLPNLFGILGYCIIGIFVVSWVASVAIHRWCGFHARELKA
jgi:high-affinity nickel permease